MRTISNFMMKLHKDLIDSRGIAETTATQYIRNLYSLNNERPFDNLAWLKNTESVHLRLSEFAESTQKSILACIVSALTLVKDKPTYKKVYTYWFNEMMDRSKDKEDSSKKSERQEANWLSWEVVKSHEKRLMDDISKFESLKELTPAQYDTVLSLVVLSLYTMIPPRRNQDYQYMYVVKKEADAKEDDMNYLVLDSKKFIFNKYKTAKTHGKQTFDIPDELMDIIKLYLKHSPVWSPKQKKPVYLLVNYHGEPLLAVNSITRILNRIFGKKVGATMLRHIYLSYKYDISEMKQDADAMGHSLELQRQYLKGEGVSEVLIPEI